jgi:hypothetical protein
VRPPAATTTTRRHDGTTLCFEFDGLQTLVAPRFARHACTAVDISSRNVVASCRRAGAKRNRDNVVRLKSECGVSDP